MPFPPRKLNNPKRAISRNPEPRYLEQLAAKVHYDGNPEHKRDAAKFGLTPTRRLKSLCDPVGICDIKSALRLLREGISRGLISVQARGDFPQNVWAVSSNGFVLEAQLGNRVQGTYHAYPMAQWDPLYQEIIRRWENHE